MSETTEPEPLGPVNTLFAHALRLHQLDPDGVLPRNGEPYPDDAHHRRRSRPRSPRDWRRDGAEAAAVLDRYFDGPGAPADLADAFRDVDVPIHRNHHLVAAALRADRERVRETGRWLVRHGTDRAAVTVGLALLATDGAEDDIPLIRTIGLLSHTFGPLAADALTRRRGGESALLWLAQRVAGWGRVYVVEELCRRGGRASRDWLLRHACDGDFLNGYFAGQVATTAHLHAAITGPDVDDALIDHTGRLLAVMAGCGGMGMTLEHYPPASAVLSAHATHLGGQAPRADRYVDAAVVADRLAARPPDRSGCLPAERDRIVRQYLAVLDRPDWCAAVRAGLDPTGEFVTWFAAGPAARLGLRAFGSEAAAADPRVPTDPHPPVDPGPRRPD